MKTFKHLIIVEEESRSQAKVRYRARFPLSNEVEDSTGVVCRHCGEQDSIVASYSEVSFGTARIVDVNGELDDYDIHDQTDFNISSYFCRDCDIERSTLGEMIYTETELEDLLVERDRDNEEE